MRKLPDLEAWAIFAKVAETGSFARAAQDFSLSQATVSKAVTRLESRMKTMLFHRTSRRIALTESGLAALERASRILQEGEAVEADVMDRSTSLRGLIRMGAPMSFGIQRLAPLLPGFMELHPEVELSLSFNDQQLDLIGERVDLAVRIANLVDSTLLARKLCTVKILLVGAPSYFARHGRPQHPRDLARHGLLHDDQDGKTWTAWLTTHAGDIQPARHLYLGHAGLALEAAAQGQGVAMGDNLTAAEDLASGRLVRPFNASVAALGQYALVCERIRLEKPAVANFLDWFADQLAD